MRNFGNLFYPIRCSNATVYLTIWRLCNLYIIITSLRCSSNTFKTIRFDTIQFYSTRFENEYLFYLQFTPIRNEHVMFVYEIVFRCFLKSYECWQRFFSVPMEPCFWSNRWLGTIGRSIGRSVGLGC